jgi:hypothetical protein
MSGLFYCFGLHQPSNSWGAVHDANAGVVAYSKVASGSNLTKDFFASGEGVVVASDPSAGHIGGTGPLAGRTSSL